MIPGPDGMADAGPETALWPLLAASERDDAGFATDLDAAEPALTGSEPLWACWRHALAARRALADGATETAASEVAAALEALDKCPPTVESALVMAYLAHIEATADRFDSAMLLAVDASLLTEDVAPPSRSLHEAHRWLSRTLTALDLEELAVAHSRRARAVATALPDTADRWRVLLLAAQQHTELAQTLLRQGDTDRARELATVAIESATEARGLDEEPEPAEQDLLDVVQAWAMSCSGDLDDALGPLRRVRRHLAGGPLWLRGYGDLALARLLGRLAARDGDAGRAEESLHLLVEATSAFAAVSDRRRYRQCLLELGQATAALGRPAEALHWLEAYRADTGRAHARGREMWAEMFVRRSRLREAQRQADLLRRHALEDPLTGLGNRRSAERRLAGLRPADQPVSLAVVDVDGFKEVNDGSSHTGGDAVLRRVADLLLEHCRTGDEVYRWAGDEFLVVLPTATEAQAVTVMERLRAAVAGAPWTELGLDRPVTVSIGVATTPWGPDGDATPIGWRSLFDTADLHLFSAKRSGRNRVRGHGVNLQLTKEQPPPDVTGAPA